MTRSVRVRPEAERDARFRRSATHSPARWAPPGSPCVILGTKPAFACGLAELLASNTELARPVDELDGKFRREFYAIPVDPLELRVDSSKACGVRLQR
jgi:hypothetical protein